MHLIKCFELSTSTGLQWDKPCFECNTKLQKIYIIRETAFSIITGFIIKTIFINPYKIGDPQMTSFNYVYILT